MPEIMLGDILLIEGSLKSIEEIERAFSHLKLCGVFDKISAIVMGKHECFDNYPDTGGRSGKILFG